MADEPAEDRSALVDLRHSLKQVKHLSCCSVVNQSADLYYAMRWATGSYLVVLVTCLVTDCRRVAKYLVEGNVLLTSGPSTIIFQISSEKLHLHYPPSLLMPVQGF